MKKSKFMLYKSTVCLLLAIVMMAGMCMPVGATGEVSLDALENVHIVDAEAVTEEPSVEEPAVAQAPAALESSALESSALESSALEAAMESAAMESSALESAAITVGTNTYPFSGGRGTEASPYLISTNADLEALRAASSAYYAYYEEFNFAERVYFKQTANLALSGAGIAFFAGVYDGDGHSVALSINQATNGYMAFIGMFGGAFAVLKNLTLTGTVDATSLTGIGCVGAVSGHTDGGKLYNVGSTAAVIGGIARNVGGLAGVNYTTTTANCWCTGTVSSNAPTGTAAYNTPSVGGLFGASYRNTVFNCWYGGASKPTYTAASINHGWLIGDAVGDLAGTVACCYAPGANVAENIGKGTGDVTTKDVAQMKSADFVSQLNTNKGNSENLSNYAPGLKNDLWNWTANSGAFPTLTAAAAPITVPGAPTNLKLGSSGCSLSWTEPANNGGAAITKYIVSYQTGSAAAKTKEATGTSTTLTGLTSGASYTITVKAVNSAGESAPSNSVSYVVKTPPSAVTGLTVSGTGTSRTLRWTAPEDNGGADIQKYTISYCKMSDVANLPLVLPYDKSVAKLVDVSGSTTYTLTGLVAGAEYFFTVAAVNDAGTGDMVSYLDGMLSGGSGTEADPYLISKDADLVKLREASRAYHQCYTAYYVAFGIKGLPTSNFATFGNGLYFKQTVDLSLSGAGILSMSGTYDGGGHSVALSLNNTSSNAVAFIEGLGGDADHPGTLKNITATGSVNAENLKEILSAGALVGTLAEDSKLYNANSVAEVKGGTAAFVGGLVGRSLGLIANCGCAGIVSSTTDDNLYIGGLAGVNTGIIFNCWYGGASKPTYTTASVHCGWLIGDTNFIYTGNVAYGYAPGASVAENIGYGTGTVTTKTVAQMQAADFATLLNNNKNNSNNLSTYAPGLTASDLKGWQANSNALPTLVFVTAPGAPTNLSAVQGTSGCNLSWAVPADNGGAAISKYVVSYQTGSAAAKTKEVTGTSTTLTDLLPGATYTITVKAVNSAGESAASNSVTYTEPVVGVTISGKLSFTGKVGGLTATVALLQGGETKYSESVSYVEGGNTYTLSNVAAGTYTLQITKLGHLTYSDEAFVVGEEAIELNDFRLFAGKVTTGNRILFSDLQQTVGYYNSSDALYDFDESGKVQMNDLMICCIDYNKEYTTLTPKQQ